MPTLYALHWELPRSRQTRTPWLFQQSPKKHTHRLLQEAQPLYRNALYNTKTPYSTVTKKLQGARIKQHARSHTHTTSNTPNTLIIRNNSARCTPAARASVTHGTPTNHGEPQHLHISDGGTTGGLVQSRTTPGVTCHTHTHVHCSRQATQP